jgi:hypothetical protein
MLEISGWGFELHLQKAQRKNQDDGKLRARSHPHFPHEEDWQDAERPVCKC